MPKIADDVRLERREQFVAAARRCVAGRGFHNLSVDDVCAEAGLSKGAFYTYFDSKQDLLLALLELDAEHLDGLLPEPTEPARAVDALRAFLAGVVERGGDEAAVQLRADLWAELAVDPALRSRFLQAMKDRRGSLARSIGRAINEGEIVALPENAMAAVLLALADGLMLHRALDPAGFRWRNVSTALDTLLEGITVRDVADAERNRPRRR